MNKQQVIFSLGSLPLAAGLVQIIEWAASVQFSGVEGALLGILFTSWTSWLGKNGLRGVLLLLWRGLPGTDPKGTPALLAPPGCSGDIGGS